MKKIIMVLSTLIVFIITLGLSSSVIASDLPYDYNILKDGTIEIADYYGTKEKITIPEEIDGYVVTQIGRHAFYFRKPIEVILPDTVKYIDDFAFNESNVSKITLSSNLIRIGNYAFSEAKLTSINLPDSVEYIGVEAFYGNNIKEVYLSENVKAIGDKAFGYNVDEGWNEILIKEFSITGTPGTAAEKYAKKYKYQFYNVNATDMAKVKGYLSNTKYTYDGTKKYPNVTVKHGSKTLVKDKDYKLDYFNNITVGTGKVIITGLDLYRGVIELPFKIVKPKEIGLTLSSSKAIKLKYATDNTNTQEHYSSDTYGSVNYTYDLIDHKNRMNVVTVQNQNINISVMKGLRSIEKTITISWNKQYGKFGAITIDDRGNFYVLYGKDLGEKDKNKENIFIIKYDNNGKQIGKKSFKGKETGANSDVATKLPFNAASASMAYNDGVIAIIFGREMFKSSDGLNHQSSAALLLNSSTLSLISRNAIYSSHSFEQLVIPVNGGFLMAEKGDGYPRGFAITKVTKEGKTGEMVPFHFREGSDWAYGYNSTYAELGGLAESQTTYALAASSEKTLSRSAYKAGESRNVFVRIMDKNLDGSLDNYIKGEVRKAQGKNNITKGSTFLETDVRDDKIIWLSNYQGNGVHVDNVKIVSIKQQGYVVLWEKYNQKGYVNTYYAILDDYGSILTKPTVLKNARLSRDKVVIAQNGTMAMWSINTGNYLRLYSIKLK